ncbi:37S ribosomal protein S9, mitochondrial [Zancudomyces culisetae]|uniref:37S ribosomal protein S9, mitochondrial n=1 Tax=Zancudomyces culisetae TaxID=1213189 RepID=A0A1R1PX78_ZANCU|nr:37S ribosomal protein S9, mitochondrial [Zancudomyces culisetae]|eukprot:OMH85533.1 37S ribosomal protein S9, mitochondrial [Zancudomyces culisetae]
MNVGARRMSILKGPLFVRCARLPLDSRAFATSVRALDQTAKTNYNPYKRSNDGSRSATVQGKNSPRYIPDSAAYFTGKARLNDILVGIEKLLQENKGYYNHTNQEVNKGFWIDKKKLELKIETKLNDSEYEKLISKVGECRFIGLNENNYQEIEKVIDFFRSEESKKGEKNENADNDALEDPIEGAKKHRNPLVGYKDDLGRFYALGRRKSSQSRVWVVPAESSESTGPGELFINGKPLGEYFINFYDSESVLFPLKLTSTLGKYNIWVRTRGGGRTGQAESAALAISRALSIADPSIKGTLSDVHKCKLLPNAWNQIYVELNERRQVNPKPERSIHGSNVNLLLFRSRVDFYGLVNLLFSTVQNIFSLPFIQIYKNISNKVTIELECEQ